MRGSTSVGYDQFETSPEAIEQELRPAVCECRLTERLKTNYSIDVSASNTQQAGTSSGSTRATTGGLSICWRPSRM